MVAAVYCNAELLAWNRKNLSGYFEVFLNASIQTVKLRDSKGLYRDAAAGKIRDVVGIDIPFHPPISADFLIDTDDMETALDIALRLVKSVPLFSSILEAAAHSG